MEVKGSFYTPLHHTYDPELRTEEVACNLCGSDDYIQIGHESGFSLRDCKHCGLVYVSPQPVADDIPNFYEGMYDSLDPEKAAKTRSAGYVERRVCKAIARLKPEGGRLLDIGCGYGSLLKALENQPWELHGFDLNERAVLYAKQEIPAAVIGTNSVEEAHYPDNSFDCVVMIGVLEHLKDPQGALRRIRRWLVPGGVILFVVPYLAPFIRIKQQFIPWIPINFEAPRHLFDFSPPTLRHLCEIVGLGDPHVAISPPYSSNTFIEMALIWTVKTPGFVLYHLTGGRWVYPFAGASLTYAIEPSTRDPAVSC